MGKKWLLGTLVLSLGLVSAGSGALAASPSAGLEGFKTVAVSAPGKEGPATINNLTEKSIIPLMIHAKAIYTYASRGGNTFNPELFHYNTVEYRYLSGDLGTKQQLMNYVKRAYTHNAAAFYTQTLFLEYNGRMGQPNVDLGNTLDYSRATARMVSKDALTAVFELSVPPSGTTGVNENVVVKLKKVNGYWRIDVSPDTVF
ncbi:DL-endopeptidase inhibitor IseA family protein [Paenibacillus sp. MMS20-IR301]|uniref:DL-endopeptidase inhibitor IseA family protein n=1 Tax=Paenibacillus sp. MMS20-IR301 TaxID=2895946 RepID=UPI0028E7116C|nr:DL-endopeptidase inhibitor IseA family protein [Paenibacillus sp. MMS20-IR301]WNS42697.1 DL-endopeptidase inhibitor IseA family protein [Paenibacillus sp. MMS20-IR301]